MRLLTQNLAANEPVFLTLTSDGRTGATGLTLTIQVSKDGGPFATITPTVTERGFGWYNLALTAAHTDTLGVLSFHITGTGATADPADWKALVVAFNQADATRLGLAALPNQAAGAAGGLPTGDAAGRVLLQPGQPGVTIPTVTNLTNLPTMPTDWLTAAGLSAGAVTEIQTGLATPTNITAGTITNLTNLPAAPTDWLTAAGLAASAVAEVAAGVWDLLTTGHTGAGSFGAAMNAAGSAGDPLSTLVPGAYGIGTAGYRLGTFLDTNVGSRSSHTAADIWGVTGRTLSAFAFSVVLAPTGLDAIGIETGINARQALAGCLSFAAGAWSGTFPGVVSYAAAGAPGTVRITATVTDTSRSSVTLSLPA